MGEMTEFHNKKSTQDEIYLLGSLLKSTTVVNTALRLSPNFFIYFPGKKKCLYPFIQNFINFNQIVKEPIQ